MKFVFLGPDFNWTPAMNDITTFLFGRRSHVTCARITITSAHFARALSGPEDLLNRDFSGE